MSMTKQERKVRSVLRDDMQDAEKIQTLYCEAVRLQGRVDELESALQHLLEHTEHKGNACKLLAVGKAEKALEASR